MPRETLYQCLDCALIDVPNRHGRCKRCGSEALTRMIYVEPKLHPMKLIGLSLAFVFSCLVWYGAVWGAIELVRRLP